METLLLTVQTEELRLYSSKVEFESQVVHRLTVKLWVSHLISFMPKAFLLLYIISFPISMSLEFPFC